MTSIVVIGEDTLCCAIGEKLVNDFLPDWKQVNAPINTRGVTRLKANLPRYLKLARRGVFVLCIAGIDRAPCAPALVRKWLPRGVNDAFLLRFAVREAESWLLADRPNLSTFLHIPTNKIPTVPDELDDPKRTLLNAVRKHSSKALQAELISSGKAIAPGPGYNDCLSAFVRGAWNPTDAAECSPSLRRTISRLEALRTDQ